MFLYSLTEGETQVSAVLFYDVTATAINFPKNTTKAIC